MSRRPTTGRPTIARVTSMSSMAPPKAGRSSIMPSSSVKVGLGDNVPGPSRITVGEANINVVVRLRGRTPREVESTSPIVAKTQGALSKGITIETTPHVSSLASNSTAQSGDTKSYAFDRVVGPEADQAMVFDEVAKGMLDEVLGGYNCTIFAYGQTGTGKTYTMQGDLVLSPLDTPNDGAGIIPRVLHRLFSLLDSKPNTDYVVKCSYLEIYNEDLRDLLSHEYGTSGSNTQMKIYEDGKKGTMVQGAEEVGLQDLKHALKVLTKGCQRRQTAETKMNTESSRSHTIFTVTVMVKETGSGSHNEDTLRVGKFNLVDLAGSEAIGRSGATDKRAREAGMINQSLLTLGRVISALVDKGPHIPYRESKLTRLLQDSLGGRTKTCIVATVSPVQSNVEETFSTLDYALRARSIRNRPEVNSHLTKAGLLREYLGDIERLKAELIAAREKSGIYIPDEQWGEMVESQTKTASELVDAQQRAESCKVELRTKKRDFDELVGKMLATKEDLQRTREAEKELDRLLSETQRGLEVAKRRLDEEVAVSLAFERGEENLDKVAGQLKGVAVESVSDVGGLFDKLSRKAEVLGKNAGAASTFGVDLQGISANLRQGLAGLHTAQESLGQQLQDDLSAHADLGREMSQQDMVALESAFASFTDLSQTLDDSIGSGRSDVIDVASSITQIKDEVQGAVQQWANKLSKRASKMVHELLENQKEHLSMVGSVLTSTADLVDAVVSTAETHLEAEREASERARQLAVDASNAEITRLRGQNDLLTRLLSEERSKTAQLRTDLVQNFTSMIESFTDAQDASLSQALGEVQKGTKSSLNAMEGFSRDVETSHAESSNRAERFEVDLAKARETGAKQRVTGREAFDGFSDALEKELSAYGKKTSTEATKCVALVDGYCDRLGVTAVDLATKAEERAVAESQALGSMSAQVEDTHQQSLARTENVASAIEQLSTSISQSHATSSTTFAQTYETTNSTLDTLISRTATFLSSGIHEDLPTGVTPKKKSWSVPTWDRTEPRAVLIAALRARQAAGQAIKMDGPAEEHDRSSSLSSQQSSQPPDDADPPAQLSRTIHLSIAESNPIVPNVSSPHTEKLAMPTQPRVSLAIETAPLRIPKSRPKVLSHRAKSKLDELTGSRTALSVLGGENVLRKGER